MAPPLHLHDVPLPRPARIPSAGGSRRCPFGHPGPTTGPGGRPGRTRHHPSVRVRRTATAVTVVRPSPGPGGLIHDLAATGCNRPLLSANRGIETPYTAAIASSAGPPEASASSGARSVPRIVGPSPSIVYPYASWPSSASSGSSSSRAATRRLLQHSRTNFQLSTSTFPILPSTTDSHARVPTSLRPRRLRPPLLLRASSSPLERNSEANGCIDGRWSSRATPPSG